MTTSNLDSRAIAAAELLAVSEPLLELVEHLGKTSQAYVPFKGNYSVYELTQTAASIELVVKANGFDLDLDKVRLALDYIERQQKLDEQLAAEATRLVARRVPIGERIGDIADAISDVVSEWRFKRHYRRQNRQQSHTQPKRFDPFTVVPPKRWVG